MQPDELVIERLLAGKVRAKDVQQVDRDAAILQLHNAGAADGGIAERIGCNVVTVRVALARHEERQARRAARNARVVSA